MRFTLYLLCLAIISCGEQAKKDVTLANDSENSILVKEQGTFAVGGTVVKSEGEFDPIAHGFFNPADQSTTGQTLLAITPRYSIKFRKMPEPYHSFFGTAMGSPCEPGKVHPMAVKGFKVFS